MTTITVAFEGQPEALADAIVCAIHHASIRWVRGNVLTCHYICETNDRQRAMAQVMDSIDIDQAERLGCELLWIG